MTQLQKKLVGHWTMDSADTDNSIVRDRTAYDNSGNLNGTYNTGQPSIMGESVYFDGNTGSEMVTQNEINIGNSDWTVSAWIYPYSFSNYLHVFSQSNQDNFSCKVATSSNNQAGLPYFYSTDDRTDGGDASNSLDSNTWNHVVYRYNGDEIAIYIDGSKVVSNTGNSLSVPSGNYHIQGGNDEFQEARHSDTRLYLRALSESEINELYQMRSQRLQKNTLDKGLVGYWAMDDADISDGIVYDNTPYSTNLSKVSSPSTASSLVGEAISLDGSSQYLNSSTHDSLPVGNEPFTVTCWFSLDSLPSNSTGPRADIWSWGEATTANYNAVDVYDDNISFYNYSNDPNNNIQENWNLGDWYFYAVTWDGTENIAYLWNTNGLINSKSATNTNNFNVSSNGGFSIGRDWGRDTSYFPGKVDEFRVYDRVLTESEITRIYNKRQ